MKALVLFLLGLTQMVYSDYQIEVNLMQYTNTGGRLLDGTCCDGASPSNPAMCDLTETCDVYFSFSIDNIDNQPGTNYGQQTQGTSRYDDSNQINFPSCSELISETALISSNPLTFTVPSAEWTSTQTLRITADVTDFDPASSGVSQTFQVVASPFLDIRRPPAPSDDFTMTTISQGTVTISLSYRVICTAGSCGSDCTQTVDCPQWTSLCESTSTLGTQSNSGPTSPPNPCIPNPCLNNARGCTPLTLSTYECECRDGYSGVNCEIGGAVTTMLPMITNPLASTSGATVNTGGNMDDYTTTGGGVKMKSTAQLLIILVCVALLFTVML